MKVHEVKLELYEFEQVCHCGLDRHFEAIRGRYKRKHSSTKDDQLVTDIYAAGAECAVAKHLQRYWYAGVNTFDLADVAPDIEVRSTSNPVGRLIIRKNAHKERPYVLVLYTKAEENQCPSFTIVGWIKAEDGMRAEWLDNPHSDKASYFVPQSALTDVDHLKITAEEMGRILLKPATMAKQLSQNKGGVVTINCHDRWGKQA